MRPGTTWARDGEAEPFSLSPSEPDIRYIQKLPGHAKLETTRTFWRAHGVTVPHMEFTLANGSVSWQRLLAVIAEDQGEPDNAPPA